MYFLRCLFKSGSILFTVTGRGGMGTYKEDEGHRMSASYTGMNEPYLSYHSCPSLTCSPAIIFRGLGYAVLDK